MTESIGPLAFVSNVIYTPFQDIDVFFWTRSGALMQTIGLSTYSAHNHPDVAATAMADHIAAVRARALADG